MDDIEAIKQLTARYFRTMDTKQWAIKTSKLTRLRMDVSAAGS